MENTERTHGRLPCLALSLAAALALVLGLCPAIALAGEVEVEEDGGPVAVTQGGDDSQTVVDVEVTTQDATSTTKVAYIDENGNLTQTADGVQVQALSSNTGEKDWGTAGQTTWYVVNGNTGEHFSDRITVSGDVRLILADGSKLDAKKGITVTPNNSLTIYAQSTGEGMGQLVADAVAYGTLSEVSAAGIGMISNQLPHSPTSSSIGCGTVTVNGGTVRATGGYTGAGIGSAYQPGATSEGGMVTVNGGVVEATGGEYAAGIGGGANGTGGTVAVNGGNVTANGGEYAAGIGGGGFGTGGKVDVNGGDVTAMGKDGAAGIGGGSNSDGGNVGGGTVAIGHGLSVEAGASKDDYSFVSVASYCASDGKNHNGYPYARIHPATYKVTVAEGIQNGTVSVDKSEAAAGDTVKVTAKAADGYELDTVTVKDADGKQIETRDGSFTMPAKDVTVSATFTKKAEPEPIPTPVTIPDASVTAHVQRIGWMDPVTDGTAAGTTGKSRRMEALTLRLPDGVAGGIEYRGHVQRSGWEKTWAADGAQSGTTGKSRRVEAVQIRLTGEAKDAYDVYYRVHVQRYGWMAWAKNGEEAGTQGMSRRAEAIQVVLVKKDAPAPDATYKGVTQQYAKAFVRK